MKEESVKRLALVFSIQAEIEGMKAENEKQRINGNAPYYSNDDFYSKSQELENLAYCHHEQL